MAKTLTLTSQVLLYLLAAEKVLLPWMNPYYARNKQLFGSEKNYKAVLYRLHKRGWIRFVDKHAERFVKFTRQGELSTLFRLAMIPGVRSWDGKWRLFMFDIPEAVKAQRSVIRRLLKEHGYYKLQGSVYISPYPMSVAAVDYLKKSRLIDYIRIFRVDAADDDADIRKHFKLTSSKI